MDTNELIEKALSRVKYSTESGIEASAYALIAIAQEMKRANDLRVGELEADEIWQAWDKD